MQKTSRRVLAIVLALVMALSVFSISAVAYTPGIATTHTVFKHTEQTLAPGVEYYNNYAYTVDGKQNVYFVTTADVTRDDVVVQTSYYHQYDDETMGMQTLTNQIAYANAKYSNPEDEGFISEYYNVVAGANASFYNMATGQPSGITYIDGTYIGTDSYPAYFAILKDGTAIIDDRGTQDNYDIWQACGGSQWLVRNGEDVTGSAAGDYNTDRHCRTAVGITAEGKVVLMVLDGRQEPYSIGGSMHEIAQIMLEADCVSAINLDGGGSTTYAAKLEGEDSVKVVDKPSDGSERSISTGIIIASLAAPSDTFDHVSFTVDNDYVMPGASTNVTVKGVTATGTTAEIPENIEYVCNNGVFADGVFTAGATAQDTVVSAVVDGNTVGSFTIHVVNPDILNFKGTSVAAPYGKSVTVKMNPQYTNPENNVAYDVEYNESCIDFEVQAGYGSMNGFVFTATDDTSVTTAGTITAYISYDHSVSASVPLKVGKESQVLFDFEENIDGWGWYDYYDRNGTYKYNKHFDIYQADAETGKVHSGEHSLAIDLNFDERLLSGGYDNIGLTYNKDKMVLNSPENCIDITGATNIGFWLYLPEGVDAFNIIPRVFFGAYNGTKWTRGAIMGDTLGEVDADKYREGGWFYFDFDLSAYSSYPQLVLSSMSSDRPATFGTFVEIYACDYGFEHNGTKNVMPAITVYLDDYSVDYSSVKPDRNGPVFSSVKYANTQMSDAAELNGQTSANDVLSFSAKVDDYAEDNSVGLDSSTAKVYIDGYEVASSYSNGFISVSDITLPDGLHSVKFEMADNNGNYTTITRNITVDVPGVDAPAYVAAKDTSITKIKAGSLYYIDVVSNDIANTDTLDVSLKVDTTNTWEPQGIEVADGFSYTYSFDEIEQIVTIHAEKTGTVTAEGEAAVISVPVRAWYYTGFSDVYNTAEKVYNSSNYMPIDIQVFTKFAKIGFADGTEATFAGDVKCDHEIDGKAATTTLTGCWHVHTAEALADKAATCTEDGYTGRTYCAVCDSVVDWGEIVPATGHNYELTKKAVHYIINGDGWQTADLDFNGAVGLWLNGDQDGKKTVGTYELGADADPNTIIFTYNGAGVPNVYTWVDGADGAVAWPGTAMEEAGTNDYGEQLYKFTFEEQPELLMCTGCGKLFTGEFTDGKYYVEGVPAQGWVDNKYYTDGVYATGIVVIDGKYYEFDENGESLGLYTGLVQDEEGVYHYSKFGEPAGGWFEIDEEWYYFDTETLAPVAEKTFTYPNSKAVTTYQFEETGKIVDGVWVDLGIGTRYYYGPDFYKLTAKTGDVWFADVHGNTYGFDGNGFRHEGIKFIKQSNNPKYLADFSDDGVYNGPYTGIYDGKYYVEGFVNAAGLIDVDGDYYYITQQGKVFTSGTLYLSDALTNGLVPAGKYEFAEDGKMVLKNGIIDGYYYEDGTIVPSKGLVKIDGYYYYIKQTGQVFIGNGLYVSDAKANGLKPAGSYDFDAEGKMIVKDGIVDGKYYVDGSLVKSAGLVKVDGAYYYIKQTGEVFVGNKLYVSEAKANGYKAPGYYDFAADGKMVVKEGIIDGNYYEDGSLVPGKGLVEIDGSYYFVKQTGAIFTGSSLYVSDAKANGLVAPGYYQFNADGTMIVA